MRRVVSTFAVLALFPACDGAEDRSAEQGVYELPEDQAAAYETAYIAGVVAAPAGDDLAEGAGEHVIIANNATIRIDMGGWWLAVGEVRLPLGIGRQIDVGARLRVHTGSGESDAKAVFVGLTQEALPDDGATISLRDAVGTVVAEFTY